MIGGKDLIAGFEIKRLGNDVQPQRGVGQPDDIFLGGAQFGGQRDAGHPHGLGQLATEELHWLGFELALPALIGLKDRARAGAEGAVIEENDILTEEELPRKIFGHVNGLSKSDQAHRAVRRQTGWSPAR